MQKLPVEVLLPIFQSACTDGGYTGCSLSQVSRAVRIASVPVRFYSLALSIGHSSFATFLALYQKLLSENDARPKIIHLHLEDEDGDHIDPDADEAQSRDDATLPSYPQAIRLLHLVAEDLVSLVLPSTLMISSPSCDIQLSDRPFTSLQVIVANVPIDQRSSVLGTSAVSPLFPVLTHAHIVMDPRSASLSLASFSAWSAHAPRATHLRISFCSLNMEDGHLLLGTPTAYRVGSRPMMILRPPPATRAWPSVRHIALQPRPRPVPSSHFPYGAMMVIYWSSRDDLSWMVKWANDEKIFESARVLVPKPSGTAPSSSEWRAAAREAWERVVIGGIDSDWLTLGEVNEPSDPALEV